METGIVVKLQFEALHNWPSADSIPAVSYLKHPHRHTFFITIKKPVAHADRDIEIICFKNQIRDFLNGKYKAKEDQMEADFGAMSCEMIAKELAIEFSCHYVEVLEDGENGGYFNYQPKED